jgi:hypothetical protein
MAEGREHHRLKVVAMAFLKKHCVDLVAAEVKFRNMRSRADACGVNLKRKEVRVVECKASRADFLRDKKLQDARKSYLPHCTYFYICCPPGVVTVKDVPGAYGLLYVDAKGKVTTVRAPRKNKDKTKTRFETVLRNTCRAATNDLLFNHHRIAKVAPTLCRYADE